MNMNAYNKKIQKLYTKLCFYIDLQKRRFSHLRTSKTIPHSQKIKKLPLNEDEGKDKQMIKNKELQTKSSRSNRKTNCCLDRKQETLKDLKKSGFETQLKKFKWKNTKTTREDNQNQKN